MLNKSTKKEQDKKKGYRKAYESLEATERISATSPQLLLSKIKILRKWGKDNLALAVCKDLNSRFPLNKEGWRLSMNLSRTLDDHTSLEQAAKAMLELEDNDSHALRDIVECSLVQKRYSTALSYAKIQVKVNPDKPVGWLAMAEATQGMNDITSSLAYVERALHLNPEYARALIHHAFLLHEETPDKARESLSKAMEINPALVRKRCVDHQMLNALLD